MITILQIFALIIGVLLGGGMALILIKMWSSIFFDDSPWYMEVIGILLGLVIIILGMRYLLKIPFY